MNKNKHYLLVYLSSMLVAAGVYLPFASVRVYGEVSYMRIAPLGAGTIIALAASFPALIFLQKTRMTVLPVTGIWLVLFLPAIKRVLRQGNDPGIMGVLVDRTTAPLRDFAARLFLNIPDFRWGGFVFVSALLCLSLATTALLIRK